MPQSKKRQDGMHRAPRGDVGAARRAGKMRERRFSDMNSQRTLQLFVCHFSRHVYLIITLLSIYQSCVFVYLIFARQSSG